MSVAFEEKATECVKVLMTENFRTDWNETKGILLHQFDIGGKCPMHIAARRGFAHILALTSEFHSVSEGNTGFTVLHSAANLGNQYKAATCVKTILENIENGQKKEILNSQDKDGCTPLYLAADSRNLEATKLLLLAGSGFDIP